MKTKNLFLISMAGLFLMTACSSDPQAKAKKSIEAYLKAHLNDPSSYEFVSIDSLEPYTLAEDKRQSAIISLAKIGEDAVHHFKELQETTEFRALSDKQQDSAMHVIIDVANEKYSKDSAQLYSEMASSFEADNKKVIFYRTQITYRAKNKLGALGLETNKVTLDSAFNVDDLSQAD